MDKKTLKNLIEYLLNKDFYKDSDIWSPGYNLAIKEIEDLLNVLG